MRSQKSLFFIPYDKCLRASVHLREDDPAPGVVARRGDVGAVPADGVAHLDDAQGVVLHPLIHILEDVVRPSEDELEGK